MSETYEFTKAGAVLPEILDREIVDAGLPKPLGVTHKSVGSPNLWIEFEGVLDSGQQTTLDGVVTAHPLLTSAKTAKKHQLKRALWDFAEVRYDNRDLILFTSLGTRAHIAGKTNRRDYCNAVFEWIDSCFAYAKDRMDEIDVLSTVAAVAAYTYTFTSLIVSDPENTIVGAYQITD